MEISGSASELYKAAIDVARKGADAPEAGAPDGQSFGETVNGAVKGVVEGMREAEAMSADMMSGKAEPHSVVEALAAAELALQTAVTVRDKVVEAYQEILRMPI